MKIVTLLLILAVVLIPGTQAQQAPDPAFTAGEAVCVLVVVGCVGYFVMNCWCWYWKHCPDVTNSPPIWNNYGTNNLPPLPGDSSTTEVVRNVIQTSYLLNDPVWTNLFFLSGMSSHGSINVMGYQSTDGTLAILMDGAGTELARSYAAFDSAGRTTNTLPLITPPPVQPIAPTAQ